MIQSSWAGGSVEASPCQMVNGAQATAGKAFGRPQSPLRLNVSTTAASNTIEGQVLLASGASACIWQAEGRRASPGRAAIREPRMSGAMMNRRMLQLAVCVIGVTCVLWAEPTVLWGQGSAGGGKGGKSLSGGGEGGSDS